MKALRLALFLIATAAACNWWNKIPGWTFVSHLVSDAALPDSASDEVYTVEMSDNDYLLILGQAKFQFIYFYSDNCKYCRIFEPDFAILEQLFNPSHSIPQLQLVKVNAPKSNKLSNLFSLRSYPTLVILNNETSEIHRFDQDRNLDNVVKFITSVSSVEPDHDHYKLPIFQVNDNNLDVFLANQETDKLIVFASDWMQDWLKLYSPTHFYQSYPKLYSSLPINFALADVEKPDSQRILKHFKVSNTPSIVFVSKSGRIKEFQTSSENKSTYSKKRLTDEQLRAFVNSLKYYNDDAAAAAAIDNNNGHWYDDYASFCARDLKEQDHQNIKNNEDPSIDSTVDTFDQGLDLQYDELLSEFHL